MIVKELIEKLKHINPELIVRAVDTDKESFFIDDVKESDNICWLWEEE